MCKVDVLDSLSPSVSPLSVKFIQQAVAAPEILHQGKEELCTGFHLVSHKVYSCFDNLEG